jgi:hypothetical protein
MTLEFTPLEECYREKLLAVFRQVSARKPEKGVETPNLRARAMATENNLPAKEALEGIYQGAAERTACRVELLARCPLAQAGQSPDVSDVE